MKKLLVVICVFFTIGLVVFGGMNGPEKQEYIRIHIRANSNSEIDQNVKYYIKDKVVCFLTPYLAQCQDKQDFIEVINNNLKGIEEVANDVLKEKGFNYKSKASFRAEEFPTRSYDNFVLESGIYDAIILELGSAEGDNWWCVVYPPLCFVDNNNQDVMYKSKILEILELIINGGK